MALVRGLVGNDQMGLISDNILKFIDNMPGCAGRELPWRGCRDRSARSDHQVHLAEASPAREATRSRAGCHDICRSDGRQVLREPHPLLGGRCVTTSGETAHHISDAHLGLFIGTIRAWWAAQVALLACPLFAVRNFLGSPNPDGAENFTKAIEAACGFEKFPCGGWRLATADAEIGARWTKNCHKWTTCLSPDNKENSGEPNRIRTCDPLIKSQLLYQLSYGPTS